jgi:hypothetical protein
VAISSYNLCLVMWLCASRADEKRRLPIGEIGVPKSVAASDAKRFFRAERRAKLKQTGAFLTKTKPTASKRVPEGKLAPSTKAAVSNIAKLVGLGASQRFVAFKVKGAPALKGRGAKTATALSRYHITIVTSDRERTDKVKQGMAVVAKELNGRSSATASTTSAEPPTMNSTQPVRGMALHGRVRLGSYGKGSKSEREVVFLETSDARYVLRRKTGPVFGDTELTRYVGHEVECDGFVVGTTLLAERIELVEC